MLKKMFRYFRSRIQDIQDIASNPFAIDCFGEMRRQLDRMPEDERRATIERIRKKIDELD